MTENFNFFKTTMPVTRKADYYLGCFDGSVFIDFNRSDDNGIYLVRISFDGYGCCNINEIAGYLSNDDSKAFINEMEKKEMNQETLTRLIKELITINKDHIWMDVIEEYGFIEMK